MSQDNTLISIPTIRPRPCAYLGRNYYLYDNFADLIYNNRVGVAANGFRYQDWTAQTGTWTAANGDIRKTANAATGQYLSIPSDFTVGTWEFDFQNVAATDETYFVFMLNETTPTVTADGYFLATNRGGANNFDLWRILNNAYLEVIAGVWVADALPHTAKVTRDRLGNFEIFLDGVSKGVGADATLTEAGYIVLWHREINTPMDNIKVYR